MRILFFCHYFPPEVNAPASRTHENCKRWVRAGHRVTVVTCAPNCPDGVVYPGYRNRLRSRETIDGIEVVRVWTYIAANKGTLRRIANYVSYMLSATFFALFLPRPDVVISTSPQFFCGWAGILTGWLRRVPRILEIRDIWPESIAAVEAIGNRRLLRFLEWLEVRMYRAARHIVTVGEGYRRRLLEKGVPAEKMSVVMNGVDRELFEPREADPAVKERWGLAGKFVCSYVGTVGMACGLDVVLRAAALLRAQGRDDIAFLIVGDGAVRAELEEAARRDALSSVVFTGRQPKENVPALLAISGACLVHLRKTDLFTIVMPSKIFEAAGMARPIVLGVEGFAADFVREAGAGICIHPDNAPELVEALLRLEADPALGQGMGRSGHDYVAARFDRDRLADDYLGVIQRTLESP
jgi:glycosyltransferase involved in cell wall biosynthesis